MTVKVSLKDLNQDLLNPHQSDRQTDRQTKLMSFRSISEEEGGKRSHLMESLHLAPLHHGFYDDVAWRLQPATVPVGVQRVGELFGAEVVFRT